ncbi:adhesion G protein-coupled receptor B2 [Trichonephila clavipes]|nr:adhesion G protein-coupled receptor B2 [Trichonephila clavipes]
MPHSSHSTSFKYMEVCAAIQCDPCPNNQAFDAVMVNFLDTGDQVMGPWFSTHDNNLVELHFKCDFWHMTVMAGSDVVQSGRPIFDDFFQHLWPYIGNNTANVVFQTVKRLWLIRIDQ